MYYGQNIECDIEEECMKYRIDFVTNSSSASYISVNALILPSIEGKLKKFPGLILFSGKTRQTKPKLLKEYSVKIGKVIHRKELQASYSLRNEFVGFINEKYGTEFRAADLIKWDETYEIGWGESQDVDIDEYVSDMLREKYLHPNVQRHFENSADDLKSIWRKYIVRTIIMTTDDETFRIGRKYFSRYDEANSEINWKDASAEFFETIYNESARPELPIADIRASGFFSTSDYTQIESIGIQILLQDSSNNLVAYIEPATDNIKVCTKDEFTAKYLKRTPLWYSPYFNIPSNVFDEIVDSELDQAYKQLCDREMQHKYSGMPNADQIDMTGILEDGKILNKWKSSIKRDYEVNGQTLTFVCRPKPALDNFEKLYNTIDERSFYSCKEYYSSGETAELPIPSNVARNKLLEYLKVIIASLDERNIQYLLDGAIKKKNGLLYKDRIHNLAWCEIGNGGSFHVLRTVNSDEKTLVLEIRKPKTESAEIRKYLDLPSNADVLRLMNQGTSNKDGTANCSFKHAASSDITPGQEKMRPTQIALTPMKGKKKSKIEIAFDYPESITIPGRIFVTSGDFIYIDRIKFEERLINEKAELKASTTKSVNYVIVGLGSSTAWSAGVSGGTKILKALEYRNNGIAIQIVSEETFLILHPEFLN